MKLYGIFLISIFMIGCAVLLTEQSYVRIDTPVRINKTSTRVECTFPEKKLVQKIRILGEGTIQNVGVWIPGEGRWILIKEIKKKLVLPLDIKIHIAPPTDVILITRTRPVLPSEKGLTIGGGQINTVEFYTTLSKGQ